MATYSKVLLFLLLSISTAWGQNLISENIQSWTNRGGYGNYTQDIPAGTVILTRCIVANGNAASGTGSKGRVQLEGSSGVLTLPELPSVGVIEFRIASSSTRTVNLQQELSNGSWTTLTNWNAIVSNGKTYTYTLNSDVPTKLRLANPSGPIYVHDIIISSYSACTTPTELRFEQEPNASIIQSVAQTIQVKATCANGGVATSFNGPITLSLDQPGCGYVAQTVNAVNGIATFSNVKILRSPQHNLTFTATTPGLSDATSSVFSVTSSVGASTSVIIQQNDFDANTAWSYSDVQTEYGSGGSTGVSVVGIVNQAGTNVLRKSYSVNNGSDEKGSESTITFDNVSGFSAYDDVVFSFNVLSFGSGGSSSGAGNDKNENFSLEVSSDNGATWHTILIQQGMSNRLFAQSATPVVSLSLNNTQTYSSGSQSAFKINLGAISQFKFRWKAANNRTQENWAIDNVKLTGIKYEDGNAFPLPSVEIVAGNAECSSSAGIQLSADVNSFSGTVTYAWTPVTHLNAANIQNPIAQLVAASETFEVTITDGHQCKAEASITLNLPGAGGTPGLWTGEFSSDWFDCRNWSDRIVPTATTNVTINQTTNVSCVITDDAAFCNSLTLTSSNGNHPDLTIETTGSLVVTQDIAISKTAGTGTVSLTLLDDASLSARNVSITGYASAFQAVIFNESPTTTWMVEGNLTINTGGLLDMNDDLSSVQDGILELGGNWINNGNTSNFSEGNSKVILNGTGVQSIYCAQSPYQQFHQLAINKSSGNTNLNANVQVGYELIMAQGNIYTNTNLLELGKSTVSSEKGLLNYQNGFVVGKMKRWFNGVNSGTATGLFPMGVDVSGLKNRNALLEYTQAPAQGGFLVLEFIEQDMTYTGLPIMTANSFGAGFDVLSAENEGYWKIDNEADKLLDGLYTLTCTGEGFTTISDLSKITLLKRVQALSPSWFCTGMHIATSGTINKPIVSRSALSGFSNFGFGGGMVNPLPVELLDFNVACGESSTVLVTWSTGSERNSAYFDIQSTRDGLSWKDEERIAGAGNTTILTHYASEVSVDANETVYYRLKQVDQDGKITYFDAKSILCTQVSTVQMSVFPNPSNGTTQLQFNHLTSTDEVQIQLLDATGKIVFQDNQPNLVNDAYALNLTVARGIYLLNVRVNTKKISQKLSVF